MLKRVQVVPHGPPTLTPSLRVRSRSFRAPTRRHALRCAVQGLREAWQTQPNLRLHLGICLGVLALGLWYRLSLMEWLWVTTACGLVLTAELFNTAIEGLVDLAVGLSPVPLARHIKDVAAGCVLLAAGVAAVIGMFVFIPHLIRLTG